jgi:molybdopterin synthase sulfur carrier subunit
MVRIVLPYQLRTLAGLDGEVTLDVPDPPTIRSVLDALEARCPVLGGTIRDHIKLTRRPFIRFYACQKDLSNEPLDVRLPEAVIEGREPFLIIGAIAGG